MEIKKLSAEQIAALKKPLPDGAVKPHPTKTYLSSIKAIYVIERLNDVFGIGAWHLKSEVIDNKTAMIVVRSVLTVPEYGIELESFGGNDNGGEGSKNFDLGDAYKGATTDATTKICSYLGIGMDVYKGVQSNGAAPASNGFKKDDSDLPWLNETDKEFAGAVAKLKAGTTSIPAIRKYFKISKAIETKLTEQSKN